MDPLMKAVVDNRAKLLWTATKIVGVQNAEDALQETCVRLLRVDPPSLTRSKAYTYVYRALVNVCIHHLREMGRSVPSQPGTLSRVLVMESRDGAMEAAVDIQRGLASCQKQDAVALYLYSAAGMTFREVGRSLGIDQSTAFFRVKRARKHVTGGKDE